MIVLSTREIVYRYVIFLKISTAVYIDTFFFLSAAAGKIISLSRILGCQF